MNRLNDLFKNLPNLPIYIRSPLSNNFTDYVTFNLDNAKVEVVWEYKYKDFLFYGDDSIKEQLEFDGGKRGFKKYRTRRVILIYLDYFDIMENKKYDLGDKN
jgi:hypothetical protein